MGSIYRVAGLALATILFVTVLPASAAVSPDDVWSDVEEAAAQAVAGQRIIVPNRFRTVALDREALFAAFKRAPMEFTDEARANPLVMTLPRPDGGFHRFHVEESPIMEPGAAATFPHIKTFRGRGIDDSTATTRFGWTTAGFHATVWADGETYLVDPYSRGDDVHYVNYFRRDYPNIHQFECEVHGEGVSPVAGTRAPDTAGAPHTEDHNGTTLRTYRLAQAANFEYTLYHSGGVGSIPSKTAAINNGIIPTLNRVNGIYERELSVHMNLVAGFEDLVFETPADPYTNESGTNMLVENQATCDAVIGNANYDIGHVFSTGGGGIAFLASVCDSGIGNLKAGGVTGLPAPTGDVFSVDYVAHEMGHQYNAPHTFNGNAGSCSGNRTASNAYEVGSATTIMGYAGICGAQNVQSNSDDYFHVISLQQILGLLEGQAEVPCAAGTPTGNQPPTVDAGPGFSIPLGTPFTMTAPTASDPDGDPLTYCWEQFDLGPANDGSDNGQSPIFRSFPPVPSPSRTFPQWSDILNNTTTYGEVMPSVARGGANALTFRVTVRDNNPDGGGIHWDAVEVQAVNTGAPFLVTFPNGGESWTVGASETVTWNVSGTDGGAVNQPLVDILLSGNNGLSFPVTVASGIPNNGSASITVPDFATTQARIMVKSSSSPHYFFDVSNAVFEIVGGSCSPVAFGGLDSVVNTGNSTCAIDLAWSAITGCGPQVVFNVYRSTTPGFAPGPANLRASCLAGTGFTDPQVDNGVQYYYQVRAEDLATPGAGPCGGGLEHVNATELSAVPGGPSVNLFFDAVDSLDTSAWALTTGPVDEGTAPWSVVSGSSNSAPESWFVSDEPIIKDQRLEWAADLSLPGPGPYVLEYFHHYNMETNWDGGVQEYSVDGGATWFDILAADLVNGIPADTGRFTSGGYNGAINPTAAGNPLATQSAWTGNSGGFIRSAVDLADFVGHDVRFRWRAGCDNTANAVGWWVDDIRLFTGDACTTGGLNIPPLAGDDFGQGAPNNPLVINVLANDSDPDTGPSPIGVSSVNDGAHGTVVDNGNGTVTYTPNANFAGSDSFTYEITDGADAAVATVNVLVTSTSCPAPVFFEDGFETGDSVNWDRTFNPQDQMTFDGAGALDGTVGMSVEIDDNVVHRVIDDFSTNLSHYCPSFLFDPNSIVMGEGRRIKILGARDENGENHLVLFLQLRAGQYRLRFRARNDNDKFVNLAFADVADGPMLIELEWLQGTGSADGAFRMWVNGALVDERLNFNNDDRTLGEAGIGMFGLWKAGTVGTPYWDLFHSRGEVER